jgi:uncharacterized membrane-anchored protein YhcB (DUF1043 family)
MILTRLRTNRIPLLIVGVSLFLALGATELNHRRQEANQAEIERLNAELEAYRAEQQQLLKGQVL